MPRNRKSHGVGVMSRRCSFPRRVCAKGYLSEAGNTWPSHAFKGDCASVTADIRKIIIIGSGAAGLTAAIYAARANLNPLVFAGGLYGGQLMLTSDVENYPGFPDAITGPGLVEKFRAQAEVFGAEIHNEDVTRVDFTGTRRRVWVHEREFEAESIVVATGASSVWLGLDNETRLRGRGVS